MISLTTLYLCIFGALTIGASIGLLLSAMCFAAKRSDEIIECNHNKIHK